MPNDETKKTALALSTTQHRLLVGSSAALLVMLLLALWLNWPKYTQLRLGNADIAVRVAATEPAREQGLSDTSYLPQNQGMLFVFDHPARWQFWMKDMHYNLDMVWLDANKRVVYVVANATPSSYPSTVYTPPEDASAKYVLEINGGQTAADGIKVGDYATFDVP